MIDVEVDIYNAVAEAVIAEFPGIYVSGEHVVAPPTFPALFVEQSSSSEMESARDSSGMENANVLTFTANAYSNSESRAKNECKRIIGLVDSAMRGMGMARLYAQPMDNAADPSIYRMVGRWTGAVDRNLEMHWR